MDKGFTGIFIKR